MCWTKPTHDEAEKLWVPWNEQVSLHGSIDLEQVNRQLKRDYEKNDRELLRDHRRVHGRRRVASRH